MAEARNIPAVLSRPTCRGLGRLAALAVLWLMIAPASTPAFSKAIWGQSTAAGPISSALAVAGERAGEPTVIALGAAALLLGVIGLAMLEFAKAPPVSIATEVRRDAG